MLVAIQMVLFGMAQDLLEFWMELYCFFKKIAGILVCYLNDSLRNGPRFSGALDGIWGTSLAGMLEYRALLTSYVRVHILPGIECRHIQEIIYLPYTCPFPIV